MLEMLNRFAIAPFALSLLLVGTAVLPLVSGAAAQAQSCTPGRDCADKLYRRILTDYSKELATAKQTGDLAKQVDVTNRAGEARQYFGEFAAAPSQTKPPPSAKPC
jgi:hypothetical protein